MSDKTELVQLALSVNEGTRGDVVAVTPERAEQLFAARAATPPRKRATAPNPLTVDAPEGQGRLDWGLARHDVQGADTDPEDDGDDPEVDDTGD